MLSSSISSFGLSRFAILLFSPETELSKIFCISFYHGWSIRTLLYTNLQGVLKYSFCLEDSAEVTVYRPGFINIKCVLIQDKKSCRREQWVPKCQSRKQNQGQKLSTEMLSVCFHPRKYCRSNYLVFVSCLLHIGCTDGTNCLQ